MHYCNSLHRTDSSLSYHLANEYIWLQKLPGQEILSAYPYSNQRIPSYHLRRITSRVRAGIQSFPSMFQKSKKRFCTNEYSQSIMGSTCAISTKMRVFHTKCCSSYRGLFLHRNCTKNFSSVTSYILPLQLLPR